MILELSNFYVEIEWAVGVPWFLYLFHWFLSLFVKGIAGKRMVMPGDKSPLNHISLSSDIPNKGD